MPSVVCNGRFSTSQSSRAAVMASLAVLGLDFVLTAMMFSL